MAVASERNFRSHYYEKVGFRGVEEKKSLDIILGEIPIDLEKLQNFCLRFAIPGIYRSCVWKLILGIIPIYKTSQDYVWAHRVEQFEDLKRTLVLTRRLGVDPDINLTLVWLLNTNSLKVDTYCQMLEARCQIFQLVVSALRSILESEVEVLWVGQKLFQFLLPQTQDWKSIRVCLYKILREDAELVEHLKACSFVDDISQSATIGSALANLFQPKLLARLWDKVLGGSFRVLLYTVAAFFHMFRREILRMSSVCEVEDLMSRMTESEQESVLSHGIDVWQMDGCPLLLGPGAPENKVSVESSHKYEDKSALDLRLATDINIYI